VAAVTSAMDGPERALLKPSEVAALLAVSRTWVYEAAKTGRIPCLRIGGPDGRLRFIERWLSEAREPKHPQPTRVG
jgi:excisionase family DNA binding protein